MLKSKFFTGIWEKSSEFSSVLDGGGFIKIILQAAYMFIVLPLFMVTVLALFLYSLPGLVVHGVVWSTVEMRSSSEFIKVLHDLSLIACCAASIYFLLGAIPLPISSDYDDHLCVTYPRC